MTEKDTTRPPAPDSWDDDQTIVWSSPPDWDPEETVAAGAPPETADGRRRPPIEIEVRKISPSAVQYVQRAFEIWTKNRAYSLDARLTCVEVIDLVTGQSKPNHHFLGARLVGGQVRSGDSNELVFPLPMPGCEAVFQKADEQNRIRLATTSQVTRVIVHVHRVDVRGDERDHAWGRITSSGR